jgi:hypothetical protein
MRMEEWVEPPSSRKALRKRVPREEVDQRLHLEIGGRNPRAVRRRTGIDQCESRQNLLLHVPVKIRNDNETRCSFRLLNDD